MHCLALRHSLMLPLQMRSTHWSYRSHPCLNPTCSHSAGVKRMAEKNDESVGLSPGRPRRHIDWRLFVCSGCHRLARSFRALTLWVAVLFMHEFSASFRLRSRLHLCWRVTLQRSNIDSLLTGIINHCLGRSSSSSLPWSSIMVTCFFFPGCLLASVISAAV